MNPVEMYRFSTCQPVSIVRPANKLLHTESKSNYRLIFNALMTDKLLVLAILILFGN